MKHSTGSLELAAQRTAEFPFRSADAGTILLLGATREFSAAMAALCNAIGLALVHAESMAGLATILHGLQPLGLACSLPGSGPALACQAIKVAARYDPALPLLMITDGDPETLGCLDAIAALCAVTGLQRHTEAPCIEDMLAFLAQAGRRGGRIGLLPVGARISRDGRPATPRFS